MLPRFFRNWCCPRWSQRLPELPNVQELQKRPQIPAAFHPLYATWRHLNCSFDFQSRLSEAGKRATEKVEDITALIGCKGQGNFFPRRMCPDGSQGSIDSIT